MSDPTPAAPEPAPDAADAAPRSPRRLLWLVVGAVVVVAVTVFLAIGLMADDVDTGVSDALAEGERPDAPAFTLPLLQPGPGVEGPVGRQVSLADLKGSVVVINMWASWCDPCRTEAPLIEALGNRLRSKGVIVLGLNVRNVSDKARAFIREYGLTFPSLRDGNGDVMAAYGATGVPETFVIDRKGRVAVAYRYELGQEQYVQLEQLVNAVAAERP